MCYGLWGQNKLFSHVNIWNIVFHFFFLDNTIYQENTNQMKGLWEHSLQNAVNFKSCSDKWLSDGF